jgi:hypothetical protein
VENIILKTVGEGSIFVLPLCWEATATTLRTKVKVRERD